MGRLITFGCIACGIVIASILTAVVFGTPASEFAGRIYYTLYGAALALWICK